MKSWKHLLASTPGKARNLAARLDHTGKHNAGRGHTARQMQFLQFDDHGVKQNREKSRQDNRDANRARVVVEHRQPSPPPI
jgi:hypothetical protein